VPRGIINKKKTIITKEAYLKWHSIKEHGDLTKISILLGITEAKAKYIIETRAGTSKEVESITKFYNSKN
jgi:hypothetical protein